MVSGVNAATHVHFVGIGGYGMSAIARVLLDLGHHVSGSDVAEQESTIRLRDRGAIVYIGHAAAQIEGANCVVYSTAVAHDNPELTAARARNVPVLHRSQMLAQLMDERKGIAVTGAHGKTTTTSMIAYVMERCGLDPTFVVGGVVTSIGDSAKAGKGDYVVAEADESDQSFLHYFPEIAVITNIEADHLEHYDKNFDNLKQAYRQFAGQVRTEGLCVACADDANVRELLPTVSARVVTYGLNESADCMASDVRLIGCGSTSNVWFRGSRLGVLDLPMPGRHNVANALAATLVCMETGLTFEQISAAMATFHGAKRRFQVISDARDVMVIDDYAHHPTEIKATISAAKAASKRIVAVFQPQRYTRTFFLFEEFSRAFAEADEVIITSIYAPAGEPEIEGVNSERLVELIKTNSNANTRYLSTKEDVYAYLASTVRRGDMVLTMGAGDIWKVAHRLAERVQEREVLSAQER